VAYWKRKVLTYLQYAGYDLWGVHLLKIMLHKLIYFKIDYTEILGKITSTLTKKIINKAIFIILYYHNNYILHLPANS